MRTPVPVSQRPHRRRRDWLWRSWFTITSTPSSRTSAAMRNASSVSGKNDAVDRTMSGGTVDEATGDEKARESRHGRAGGSFLARREVDETRESTWTEDTLADDRPGMPALA